LFDVIIVLKFKLNLCIDQGNWSNLLPCIKIINKDFNSSLERIFKKLKRNKIIVVKGDTLVIYFIFLMLCVII